ncbi:MAG: ABC transporter ATP-binding protein/permease [Lachnospiraceae bacterium]|jgi:ABC-type multidrug transport system, ATPase and permease components|nr:ABC transporter ATP-binding protein [Lachnospiraceae bacterium]MCI8826169.1 ABC transporter ATP-binding protein [Lachnospiraceae bacterium]
MSINSVKEDEEQKDSVKIKVILRLFRYMLRYKKEIIFVLLAMLLSLSISMVNPLLMEHAIDVNITEKDWNGLVTVVAVLLALSVVFMFTSKFWMKTMARVSNKVLLVVREELYAHIQTLGFDFFDSRPTGKILARVIGDVNALKDVIQSTVTQLIPDFLTVLVVFIIMFIKSPALTFSAVAALPFIIAGMYVAEILAHKKWQIHRKKSSNITAFVHEDFSGIGIVQSFTAEKESQSEFSKIVDEHRISFRNAVLVADSFSPTIEISWGIGTFLLYYIGIQKLGVGTVGVGTFVAFSTYLSMFWGPVRNLASYYNKLVTNISAAERIFDILDTPAEVADREGAAELPKIEGRVRFEEVSFAYPDEPERFVLHNVNFDIQPGETIALVGPTGAGKSTIVNLVSRFYNATKGRVLIDEHDIQNVTIHSLRKQMGVMTQENYLFSGTIKDNIRYGRLNATDNEVIAAAKAVHAHEFIMNLEHGYDTEISERGARLSIGQRQLLAFARTMVSDPEILILDEATSSIDTHTEILVQQGIESLLQGRTSFIIAHRLSTIKNADRIFVIDEGGILEQGSHEELINKKGAYYQLYQAQFKNIA